MKGPEQRLIERCSDGVEEQGAEEALLWGWAKRETRFVRFGKPDFHPHGRLCPFSVLSGRSELEPCIRVSVVKVREGAPRGVDECHAVVLLHLDDVGHLSQEVLRLLRLLGHRLW